MHLTVIVLVLAAFILTVASAMGKSPLWAAVLLLAVIDLVLLLPR